MLSSTRNLRPAWRAVRRFVRYSALSAATVPAGYALLLLAMHRWPHVNAGLLNLGVGMVLTPPSFLLAQVLVWRGRGAAPWWARLWSFWQTVLAGALASSATILVADAVLGVRGAWSVVAGLAGQGVVFVARYFWLDRVTFAGGPPPTGGAGRRAVAGAGDARGVGENGGPPPPAGGPAREEARDRQEAAAGQ